MLGAAVHGFIGGIGGFLVRPYLAKLYAKLKGEEAKIVADVKKFESKATAELSDIKKKL